MQSFIYDYLLFDLFVILQVIETLLFSTFVSWKAFFPLVRDDSNCTYTFITGELMPQIKEHNNLDSLRLRTVSQGHHHL